MVLSAAGLGALAHDGQVAGALGSSLVYIGAGSGIRGIVVDSTGAECELWRGSGWSIGV